MADVLSNYRTGDAFDEMMDAEGSVRPSYQAVYSALSRSTPDGLRVIAELLANNYTQAGVTFDVGGVERPFPLDLVPRVIASPEWEIIEAGVVQRVRALEAFLADIYADARVISDGVIPSQLVTSSTNFHRAVWGIKPANGVRIHVAGVDLIRNPAGDVRVLEDNVRVPSGVSYVMTNRNAMITAMPEVFAHQRIRRVAGYPTRLLTALRKAAPPGVDDPTVVVLTPGVYNSAYFEHTLLARTMGVELVEGRDLECRRGKVFMRTTAGLQRVDVIYRRIDDEFLDPVHFRSDSMLGVPGLVNAVRTGGVALANAIGNGVADDKLIYTYVPDLIKYYLREDPIIPNVDTWRLEEEEARTGGAGPSRGAGRQTGRRLRRQGHCDRTARHQERAGCPATAGDRGPSRVDRTAGGPAFHRANADRGLPAAAPCRSSTVRGQQWRRRVGASRGTHPRGVARGGAGRQQQPGRRQQGHLGPQSTAAPIVLRSELDRAQARGC